MATTPTIDQFLGAIVNFVKARNGGQVADYLRVEPPLADIYYALGNEVRSSFPKPVSNFNPSQQSSTAALLERKCEVFFNAQVFAPDTDSWPALIEFVKLYLEFFRDVDYDDLVQTHQLLSGLVK
jgi:hypothetical protein